MTASNQVVELSTLREVEEYLNKQPNLSTIFTDIDDTIIMPAAKIFRHRDIIAEIRNNKDTYPNHTDIIGNWRLQRKVVLVDEYWPMLLAKWQASYAVHALTKMFTGKCGPIDSTEKWRAAELKTMGLTFSPVPDGIPAPLPSTTNMNPATHLEGVFFTGDHYKSYVVEFMQGKIGLAHVVLIDDLAENIVDVANYCSMVNVPFIGIIFHGAKLPSEDYDERIGNLQKEYLLTHLKWLEDEEATKLLHLPDHD